MERRRHARTAVNINAMLIGKKTVPKGCRVRNISQQGMLLQCEPDGRLLTFSKGDKVEIHLTVQYAGEKKSLTIPSSVRHVNEAYIYVEFQHPDLKLVELIESYRVSEAYELEASVGYQDSSPGGASVTSISDTDASPMTADTQQMPEKQDTHRPFYYGLLTLVLAICIITGGYIYTASVDNRLSMLETITDKQTTELSEMRERVFSSSLQEGRYASLNARMTALTDAFTSLDSKLTRLISQRSPETPGQSVQGTSGDTPILISSLTRTKSTKLTTARPPEHTTTPGISTEQSGPPLPAATEVKPRIASRPAEVSVVLGESVPQQPAITIEGPTSESTTGAGERAVAAAANPPPSLATATRQEAAKPAPARQQPAVGIQGQWVINLLSSTDKGYVERFAARARSRDVAVEIHSAEVKGRMYWRLQITGFASASAAKAGAGPVKEKLGIKDVWIFRQKG